jgi:hypothetical protein
VACGYIESVVSGSSTSLIVTALGIREGKVVDQDTARAITAIISIYGKVPVRALMKDVYSRYSWYASRSDAKDLVHADAPKPKVAAAQRKRIRATASTPPSARPSGYTPIRRTKYASNVSK